MTSCKGQLQPTQISLSMNFPFLIMLIMLFRSGVFLSALERDRRYCVEQNEKIVLEKEGLGSGPSPATSYLWPWASLFTYLGISFPICTTGMIARRIKWNHRVKALCKLHKVRVFCCCYSHTGMFPSQKYVLCVFYWVVIDIRHRVSLSDALIPYMLRNSSLSYHLYHN